MKLFTFPRISVALLFVFLSGCLQTFYPLYTDKTKMFEPALLGTWAEENDEHWTFEKGKEQSYIVRLTKDRDTVGEFTAHLVRLKNYLFLDLFPAPLFESEREKSNYAFHFIQVHTISRLWLAGDTLRLAMLDSDWFRRNLKNRKVALPYIKRDEQLLVTASTGELQKFVVRYAEDSGAFPNPGVFVKLQ